MSKSGKNPCLFLSLRRRKLCKPGFDELLRVETRLYLVKPGLEICVLVEIPKPAEPQLPGLHIACWDADRHAIQAVAGETLLAKSFRDVLVPPLEAGGVGIEGHQEAK